MRWLRPPISPPCSIPPVGPADWPRLVAARAVAAEGPAWDALLAMAQERRLDLHPLVRWERALLDRAAAPNAQVYCRRFLSVEQRKALRRKRRRLSEAGPLALAIHAAPEETSAALETFCRIEAQGWKGRAGTALAQDPAGRAYVADVLSTMAASDQAFVAVLLAGDAPVAAGLFLRAGGEVFFWKTCYDESLARRSPGVIFDLMLTEWLYDQPWFERLDAGHDDSVDPGSMIWGQRRPMADLLIDLAPGSLRGRTALARTASARPAARPGPALRQEVASERLGIDRREELQLSHGRVLVHLVHRPADEAELSRPGSNP